MMTYYKRTPSISEKGTMWQTIRDYGTFTFNKPYMQAIYGHSRDVNARSLFSCGNKISMFLAHFKKNRWSIGTNVFSG